MNPKFALKTLTQRKSTLGNVQIKMKFGHNNRRKSWNRKGIAEVLQTWSKRLLHTVHSESALALENELNALGIKAKGYQSNAADFNEAQTMVDAVLADFGTVDTD
jgi:hypothetical protein